MKVIEYPATGATYSRDEYGVYEYGVYPEGTVLAGQEKRSSFGSYETLEEAQAEHPDAQWHGEGSGYREVTIPHTAPDWFDPADAGETWNGEDY